MGRSSREVVDCPHLSTTRASPQADIFPRNKRFALRGKKFRARC